MSCRFRPCNPFAVVPVRLSCPGRCTLPCPRGHPEHGGHMSRHRSVPLLSILALAACSTAATPPSDSPAPTGVTVEAAAATIDPADVDRRINYLASDELRGRDTPS